jgi:hypothetical protein
MRFGEVFEVRRGNAGSTDIWSQALKCATGEDLQRHLALYQGISEALSTVDVHKQ